MAVPRFQPAVLRGARERADLSQLDLARLAEQATPVPPEDPPKIRSEQQIQDEVKRRVKTWASRIDAWERGVDSPSAPYVPTLARFVGVQPLELYEVDPKSATFSELRFAAGMTLRDVASSIGVSYTSLHRMLRGVAKLSTDVIDRLATALGVEPAEVRAAIQRER